MQLRDPPSRSGVIHTDLHQPRKGPHIDNSQMPRPAAASGDPQAGFRLRPRPALLARCAASGNRWSRPSELPNGCKQSFLIKRGSFRRGNECTEMHFGSCTSRQSIWSMLCQKAAARASHLRCRTWRLTPSDGFTAGVSNADRGQALHTQAISRLYCGEAPLQCPVAPLLQTARRTTCCCRSGSMRHRPGSHVLPPLAQTQAGWVRSIAGLGFVRGQKHWTVPRCGGMQVRDCGNASPRNMRLSLNYVPNQSSLLRTCGMPLAVILQPLALLGPDDDPIPVRMPPSPLFAPLPLCPPPPPGGGRSLILPKHLITSAFQLRW